MVRSFLVYELILLLYSINNIVFQPLYQILDTLINFYIISNKSSIRFRLATIPSLISPEPLFDPRRGLLWLLGGNCA